MDMKRFLGSLLAAMTLAGALMSGAHADLSGPGAPPPTKPGGKN